MSRWLPSLLLAAASLSCFGGQFLAGAQCQSSDQCGPQLECIDGFCGGCSDCQAESETGEASSEVSFDFFVSANRDVDILLVIDNSASMARAQANLVATVSAFITLLEHEDINANYRIAITTTDAGNPWCGLTTPEAGALIMSSCEQRIDEFVLDGGQVDVRDAACNTPCTLDAAALELLPTTTDYDPEPHPRPWLERINGHANLPASTNTAAAFACFGPQGIAGCEFESPLESMYLALQRANTPDDPAYGFVRRHAVLAVMFLTDEVDCSHTPEFDSIFAVDGGKTFWSDPSAAEPTSAVCWNAGVACVGDPSGYESCSATNKDVDGKLGVDDGQAVLRPLRRYVELLQALEDDKKFINDDNEIIVGLIGGVGPNGQLVYADASQTDPLFQDAHGIGPGCTADWPDWPDWPGEATAAVPPVRLRELSDAFTPDSLASICSADASNVFYAIAQRLKDQVLPGCFPACVRDADPDTSIVEPTCTVQEDPPGDDDIFVLPECLRDANGYVLDPQSLDYAMPNDGANVCFALLVDAGGLSADPGDDIHGECIDAGSNLELRVSRRPGFPAASGTVHSATCVVADAPALSCPGLGG